MMDPSTLQMLLRMMAARAQSGQESQQVPGLGGSGKGGGQQAPGGLGATPPIMPQPTNSLPAPQPMRKPGLFSRIAGNITNNVFPMGGPGQEDLTPEQQQKLQDQARTNFALQLLGGAGSSGRGLGGVARNFAASAFGAQRGLTDQLGAYQQQADRAYRRGRDTLADTRYSEETAYARGRDLKADDRQKLLDARQAKLDQANEDYRQKALLAERDQSAGSRAQAAVAMERLKTERSNHAEVTKILDGAKGRKLTADELNRLQLLSGQSLPGQAYMPDLGDMGGMAGIPMYVPGKGFVTPGQ